MTDNIVDVGIDEIVFIEDNTDRDYQTWKLFQFSASSDLDSYLYITAKSRLTGEFVELVGAMMRDPDGTETLHFAPSPYNGLSYYWPTSFQFFQHFSKGLNYTIGLNWYNPADGSAPEGGYEWHVHFVSKGAPIFTDLEDNIDISHIDANYYIALDNKYDALSGNDKIILPPSDVAKTIGYDASQTFFGNLGMDVISGNNLNDIIDGGADNDTLSGGEGDDTLIGGSEDDRIIGIDPDMVGSKNDGNNTISGGDGKDSVVWSGKIDLYKIIVSSSFSDVVYSRGTSFKILTIDRNNSDTLIDKIEHPIFGGEEISLDKISGAAAFGWIIESIKDKYEKIFEAAKWWDVKWPKSDQKIVDNVLLSLKIIQLAASAAHNVSIAKQPYKQLFVEAQVLVIDAARIAVEKAAGGVAAKVFISKYIDPQFDALELSVRKGSPVVYDLLMKSIEPTVDKFSEVYGNFIYSTMNTAHPKNVEDNFTNEQFNLEPQVPVRSNGTGKDDFYQIQPATLTPNAKLSATLNFEFTTNAMGGNDIVVGSAKRDSIVMGAGNDFALGMAGNDRFAGVDSGRDTYDGGSGFDTIDYSASKQESTVNLRTGTGSGKEIGTDILVRIEGVVGGSGADRLTGDINTNDLSGRAGTDILNGGGGKDILTGGSGRDVFVFGLTSDSAVGAKRDVIKDFSHGQGDTISLSAIDAIKGTAKNDAFNFLTKEGAAFAKHAGELHFDQQGSGAAKITLVEGDINGDGKADFSIELMGWVTLVKGDFIL